MEPVAIAFEAILWTRIALIFITIGSSVCCLVHKFLRCLYFSKTRVGRDSDHDSVAKKEHASGEDAWIDKDGNSGEIADMKGRKVQGAGQGLSLSRCRKWANTLPD